MADWAAPEGRDPWAGGEDSWPVLAAAAGAVLGLGLGGGVWGALSGLAFGWLIASLREARARIRLLAARVDRLDPRLAALERANRPEPVATPAVDLPAPVKPPAEPASPARSAPAPGAQPSPAPRPPERSTDESDAVTRVLARARELLFGGNTVVRVGVLVLLVGLALLARYAAEHAVFPIEARLAATSLIGVALTVVGYRQRTTRPGFAAALQGGGVAALYLVVFFAFRLYALVPAGLAFGLFVAIAAAGAGLAVLQRVQSLAVIGSLGGFLAPLLAASGEGNHVVLFSYYLLLDASLAAIAWFRAWRALNGLAFVCTYLVATTWGVLRYEPEHFASTEPFLLAFLLLFTAVAILFAWRRAPDLRGVLDGTLVFGVPLMTLLAQTRLVSQMEYGLAVSSAGFGLFYAGLASGLWRAAPASLRPLCEAFLALAVGFGTMAIPFAFDDAVTTGIAWALEGAGLYWVGARQQRGLARLAGGLLQPLALVALALDLGPGAGGGPARFAVANGRFLSYVALSLAGLFIAREAQARRGLVPDREARAAQLFALWGLLWWSVGGICEIDRFVPGRFEAAALVLWIAASGLALEAAAGALRWQTGRQLALVMLPAAFLALPFAIVKTPHLLAGGGLVAWPLYLAALYFVLRRLEDESPAWLVRAYAPALWLVAVVTAIGLAGVARRVLEVGGDWPLAAFGYGLGAVLLAALFAVERRIGAFGRLAQLQLREGLTPVAALGLLWALVADGLGRGDSAPLPYLPLASPLDAAMALVFLAILAAWRRGLRECEPDPASVFRYGPAPLLAASGFLWLNAILARSVHQWTGVDFRISALWDSVPLQVSISIAWTLLALAVMLASTSRGWRRPWIVAAGLLGTVVVKLFLVDLSQLSTLAKIGTFLVVGSLLLVVGYLSPVPPADGSQTARTQRSV